MLVLEQAVNMPRVRHYVISSFKTSNQDCHDYARLPSIHESSGYCYAFLKQVPPRPSSVMAGHVVQNRLSQSCLHLYRRI